jgi:hypothetical protein
VKNPEAIERQRKMPEFPGLDLPATGAWEAVFLQNDVCDSLESRAVIPCCWR